jgi:origin recognition complex subunit 3
LNPNIRASIISGLLNPHVYLRFNPGAPDDHEAEPDLHLLPDISILFRRYLDSGKLINVWDWYQSFVAVCDTQRAERKKNLELARNQANSSKSKSPKKKKGKTNARDSSPTKGSGKGKEVDQECVPEEEEPDEETWSQETHARFIRTLHELDYLGFIRHTGRKKDCVMRTVWEGEWDE